MTRDTMTIQVPMTTKILHNIYFHNYWLTATLGMQHTATPQYNSYITQSFTITGFHGAYTRTSMASGVIHSKQLYNQLTTLYYKLNTHVFEARWSLLIPTTKLTKTHRRVPSGTVKHKLNTTQNSHAYM